jgi:hypothetical protein
MAKVTDATFYHGKAPGGINSTTKVVGDNTWEVQELLDYDGKVYFRLYVLWNDIDTREYFTAIRKEFIQDPVAPATTVVNPF